jgi:hypothetical protein
LMVEMELYTLAPIYNYPPLMLLASTYIKALLRPTALKCATQFRVRWA